MNHCINVPCSSHRPDGGSEFFGRTAVDIRVATLLSRFPKVAKKTSRLMATQVSSSRKSSRARDLRFRYKGKYTNVLIMKAEPITENTDAVRIATTRPSALPCDNGGTILLVDVRMAGGWKWPRMFYSVHSVHVKGRALFWYYHGAVKHRIS